MKALRALGILIAILTMANGQLDPLPGLEQCPDYWTEADCYWSCCPEPMDFFDCQPDIDCLKDCCALALKPF